MFFDRCPSHEMTGKEAKVIRTWSMIRSHKIWPVSGGLDDQANWFVEAVQFLDQELAQYQERERKRKK